MKYPNEYEYKYEATPDGWVLTATLKKEPNPRGRAFAAWNNFCEIAGLDPKDRNLRIVLGMKGSWKGASENKLNALALHFDELVKSYDFVSTYTTHDVLAYSQ